MAHQAEKTYRSMSLRRLINLRIALSVVILLVLGSAVAIWEARKSVREEVNASYHLALEMLRFGLQQFPYTDYSEKEWLEQLSMLGETRHVHITVIDSQGHALSLYKEDEINQQELPPDWFVRAVTSPLHGTSHEVNFTHSKEVSRIIIDANPIDEIIEAWRESKAYLWFIVVMMGCVFFLVNIVFRSMLRAVQGILVGLKQVEEGHYETQLPHFRISEFDVIAGQVNSLSNALNQARHNNQALARHTMAIQERERAHLSRELHDEMGQSLTAVKAMAVAVKQPDAKVVPIADTVIDICNHLAVVVRSMMRTLHPLSLRDLGLSATLMDLVNEWQRRQPDLTIELDYDEHLDEVAEALAIHIYRIVQECLTNVVRHARTDHAFVSVKLVEIKGQRHVLLRVEDDGVGGDASSKGFGVLAMRERVESLGGHFSFASRSGRGTRVSAWIPCTGKTYERK